MAKTKQAKIQPDTVDEAKIAEINASTLAAPEAPAVDLLGDPVVEAAPEATPEERIAALEQQLDDAEAENAQLEDELIRLEARIEQLLAEKAKPALTHARTLDELPSPFAPA